jgi:integrase
MPRKAKGYSKTVIKRGKKFYGRLRLKRPDGSFKTYERLGVNKTHARQLADDLEEKYAGGGISTLDAEDMTFADLAEKYKSAKVIDAVYDGEIKVAGMIAKGAAEREIKLLIEYWGTTRIQAITHAGLEEYKTHLIKKPTVWKWREGDKIVEKAKGTPRKVSSVNHLLRRLRAMLNFAVRKSWIRVNPFTLGDPLISQAAEVERNRSEGKGELDKLLAACVDRREYLRPVILIMADTALRLAEVKRLTRANLDFDRKVAYVEAKNTKKNQHTRIVPLSDRVIAELAVWVKRARDDHAPILPQGDYKKAWKAVKKAAKITDDLQLRDLRGWGTSRIARALAAAGLPWEWGQKTTGHTQVRTYQRYIKTDEEVARQTGEALKDLDDKAA